MKKLIPLIVITITLLAAPMAPVGCSSTNSPSVNQIAYNSTASVESAVDHSMKAYASLVVAGKVSEADQAKVKTAYESYQKALTVAVIGVQGAKGEPNATSAAIAGAVSAAAPLISLIQELTSK